LKYNIVSNISNTPYCYQSNQLLKLFYSKRKTTSILLKNNVLSLKIKNRINLIKKIMCSFNI